MFLSQRHNWGKKEWTRQAESVQSISEYNKLWAREKRIDWKRGYQDINPLRESSFMASRDFLQKGYKVYKWVPWVNWNHDLFKLKPCPETVQNFEICGS